MTKVPR